MDETYVDETSIMDDSPSRAVYYLKEYVHALVEYTPEGKVLPREITHRDIRYEIDRVKDAAPRASFKVGGHGTRYLCVIRGREVELYYEPPCGKAPGRWYVEGKVWK